VERTAFSPDFRRNPAHRRLQPIQSAPPHPAHITWHSHSIIPEQRAAQKQQTPCVLWLTGLSGAGKSTLANALDEALFQLGHHAFVLDGDNLRFGLSSDLGFSDTDRSESARRAGEAARLLMEAGLIVIVATIAPFRRDRDAVRARHPAQRFIEIHIDAPIGICELRDPKGLYRRARNGEIHNFTGIDSPYEPPDAPELIINSAVLPVVDSVESVLSYLRTQEIIAA